MTTDPKPNPVQQLRRSIANNVYVMPVSEQRRLLDLIERMQAALNEAHDLIETVGCSPDNEHPYWDAREAANA